MKKIFSMMAVALVVFSLASCKGHNEPDQPDQPEQPTDTTVVPEDVNFDIVISDITAASALVKVVPSDTNVYYYFDLLTAADLAAGYNEDSLAKEMKESAEYYQQKFPYYLSKGTDEWEFTNLMPETEYTVYALQFEEGYKPVGKWTLKKFTTAKLEIKETVTVSGEGELENYVDLMGIFAIYGDVDDNGAFLALTFEADELEGTFTQADLDSYYGGWVVIDEDNNEYYAVVTLAAEGKLNADSTEYSFKGEAVCTNGVKYVFDYTCPNEEFNWDDLLGDGDEEYAPARRMRKAHKAFKHFGRK